MHKSTISRAVCDKYVQVQDNVYPMRIFFNNDPLHCGHTQQSIALQIRQIIEPVSYTHLDVYKRQG